MSYLRQEELRGGTELNDDIGGTGHIDDALRDIIPAQAPVRKRLRYPISFERRLDRSATRAGTVNEHANFAPDRKSLMQIKF